MASFTLTNPRTFPAGTSVEAHLASDFGPNRPTGAVSGSTAVDTQTADANGSVTFTGLTSGARYYAYAHVGSDYRYVEFIVGALSPGASKLTYDADTDTVDIDSENVTVGGVPVPVPVVVTQTATLTTDPVTFTVSHVFDLGKPSVFSIVCTVLSGDADGETWAVVAGAPAPGEIAIDVQGVQGSPDGVNWGLTGGIPWPGDNPGGPSNVAMGPMVGMAGRYVKVLAFRIVDSDIVPYAGANHPTATARFDVSVG